MSRLCLILLLLLFGVFLSLRLLFLLRGDRAEKELIKLGEKLEGRIWKKD